MLNQTAWLAAGLYLLIGASFAVLPAYVHAEEQAVVPIIPQPLQQPGTQLPQSGRISGQAQAVIGETQWRIRLIPTGERRRESRELSDTLTFRSGMGSSSRLDAEGYGRARFDALVDDSGEVQWEMLQSKAGEGAALWTGSINGFNIEGKLSVYALSGDRQNAREYRFSGERLSGGGVVADGQGGQRQTARTPVARSAQTRAPNPQAWNKTLTHLQDRLQEVESAEEKIQEAQDAAKSLSFENKGLREALEIKTQEIAYLQGQLDETREAIEQRETKEENVREQKVNLEARIAGLEDESRQLRQTNFELEHEVKSLRELNAVLQGKMSRADRLENELRDAEDRLAAVERGHSAQRVEKLLSEIEGFRSVNAELQQKLKDLRDQQKPYEREVGNLQLQIEALKKQNRDLENELTLTRQENAALSQVKHPNEAELKRLRQQVTQLSSSQEDLLLNKANLMTAQEELKQARKQIEDLKVTNTSLIGEMEQLYAQIDSHQSDLHERDEAYASLESQWQDLQDAHEMLQQKFLEQIEEIEKLKVASEQDIMTSRLRAAASERSVGELEQSVMKLRDRLEEKNAEIDTLNQQLAGQEQHSMQLAKTAEDLREELRVVRLGHAETVRKHNRLREEHQALSAQHASLKNQTPITESEFRAVKAELESTRQELERYQGIETTRLALAEKLEEKEREIVKLQNSTAATRIEALHKDLDHFRTSNLKLTEELSALKLAVKEKEEAFANAQEANERLRAEVKHYQQEFYEKDADEEKEIRLLKEELRSVKAKRDEVIFERDSVRQDLSAKIRENEDLHGQLFEVEKRLSNAYQEQEQFKQQVQEVRVGAENTQNRVAALQETLRERDNTIQILNTQLVELEGKLTSAYREHEAFQEEFFDRRIQQEQLQRQAELADDRLRDKDAEINRLRAELESLKPQVDESHRGYVLMERQSAELRAERNRLDREVQQLRRDLMESENRLGEFQKENADLQRKLKAMRLTEMRQHLNWAEQETEPLP